MSKYEIAKTFDIPISVIIRKWDHENQGYDYDWAADTGEDSDQLYRSAEEAEEDARSNFGG